MRPSPNWADGTATPGALVPSHVFSNADVFAPEKVHRRKTRASGATALCAQSRSDLVAINTPPQTASKRCWLSQDGPGHCGL